MNKVLLLPAIIFSQLIFAQTVNLYHLNGNNVNALITDGGTFFEDIMNANPSYEVPAGSGQHTIYSMGFWMYGTDMSMSHHSSYSSYSTAVELAPGPIANDYNSTHYQNTYLSSIWTVTQAEIDAHLANYSSQGYVMPNSIANWPGSGNASEGIAANLAPYVDANSNGVYDPVNGDAPYIEGDIAAYVILNDVNAPDLVWGPPLEVEVHVMFYQFSTADALNNTTFFNVRVFNRGGYSYPDFKFGIFADFDLGNYSDDFWGCDSADNYMFAYNGDNSDEDFGGMTGYGTNPPAAGIVSLSHDLFAAQTFNSGSEPTGYMDYYNMMMGYQANSNPYTHFDGYETKFQYSDELNQEYSEVSLANPSGDRRGMMVVSPGSFLSGTSFCFDYAVVYHRNQSADHVQNAMELDSIVAFVQNYYDNNIQACESYMAGVDEQQSIEMEVFPNPNAGIFTVVTDRPLVLEIYSLEGKRILVQNINPGNTAINVDVPSGVYLMRASNEYGVQTKKLIIE